MEKTLSEAELRYIELDKKKAEIKQFYEDLKIAAEALVSQHGVNHFFQDAEGTVYKVIIPEGKFVQFEKYTVCRTRRADEKSGSLSLKEAKEQGFNFE